MTREKTPKAITDWIERDFKHIQGVPLSGKRRLTRILQEIDTELNVVQFIFFKSNVSRLTLRIYLKIEQQKVNLKFTFRRINQWIYANSSVSQNVNVYLVSTCPLKTQLHIWF